MDKRLKYEKWNNCDNVITINLHNGYSVIAIWSQNDYQEFYVTLHLKEDTIDMWDLMVDDWTFNATRGTINAAILKTVADCLYNGFFEYYIERFEYYLQCSSVGCKLLESENN